MLALRQDGTVTLQLKVIFLPGPLNKLQPSRECTPQTPATPSSAHLSGQALSLSHGLCLGGGKTRVPGAQEGMRTEGLFLSLQEGGPEGLRAAEPGRVRLPRASAAEARPQAVVWTLELIFPQKQSSSRSWLLAWL